jgi:long-subunit fatty acid transport protein
MLCGAFLLAAPRGAEAAGFSNIDMGVRRMAMFSVMGKPDDGSALFHNAAGMTLLEGTHFYHSQSWFIVDLGLRLYDSKGVLHGMPTYDPKNPTKPPTETDIKPNWNVGFLPFLGLISDLGTKRWRLGVAVYAPNAYGASLPDAGPTRYSVTKALFVAGRATTAVACKVTPQFSVAASLHLIYVYLNASQVLNLLVLADPDRRFDNPYTTDTAKSDSRLDLDGHAWTWAWDLAVLFTPLPTFRIGAQFASGSMANLKGTATLNMVNGQTASATQWTSIPLPFSLRFGINWEIARNFEVGADVYWWHYQVFQQQATTFSKPILGLPGLNMPENYSNCWAWNVGLLYHVLPTLELMTGFQMDGNPIPSQAYTLENPTTQQYGVGFGARWQVRRDVRVGLAFVRNWFNLLNVQDSQATPPANMKGHGANFEVGMDVDWRFL